MATRVTVEVRLSASQGEDMVRFLARDGMIAMGGVSPWSVR